MGIHIPVYSERDEDGTPIFRAKFAKKGDTYQMRSVEFETSLLGSIFNKSYDNTTDIGDASIKFYDNVGTELTTQPDCDANCVKTVLDFEPAYDYEVIGGSVKALTIPSTPFRIWVVAVPDLSYELGGSRVMVNGINMQYLSSTDGIVVDGRTSKRLTYNNVYHTNKMRLIFFHAAGLKHKIEFVFEHYRT